MGQIFLKEVGISCLFVSIACLMIAKSGDGSMIEEITKHQLKEVISLQWGDEQGKVGHVPEERLRKASKVIPLGPRDFCVDSKGHIFVMDGFNNRIQEFSQQGQLVRAYKGKEPLRRLFTSMEDIEVGGPREHLYLRYRRRNDFPHAVVKYNSKGNMETFFEPPEDLKKSIHGIKCIDIDRAGNVFVLYYGGKHGFSPPFLEILCKYDSKGLLIHSFLFEDIKISSLAIGPRGRAWVAITEINNLGKMSVGWVDETGKIRHEFEREGQGDIWEIVQIDKMGFLYIYCLDFKTGQLHKVSPTGREEWCISYQPYPSFRVTTDGEIYINPRLLLDVSKRHEKPYNFGNYKIYRLDKSSGL